MGNKNKEQLLANAKTDRERNIGEGKSRVAGQEQLAGEARGRGAELYPGVKSGLEDLSKSGGIQDYGDIYGGYKQFAETGGFTPSDLSNIRSRSGDVIPQQYAQMREMLRRRGALSGGYQPGYGANLASMGRSAAELSARNTRDTELGISDAVRQGRLAGLGGESQLAGMKQRGIMGGISGLSDLYGGQQQLGLAEQGLAQGERGLTEGTLGKIAKNQFESANLPGTMDRIAQFANMAAGTIIPGYGIGKSIMKGIGGGPKMNPQGMGVG